MDSGTQVGPYEVIKRLGAGGMGEVYRGRDARLGRDVALKVLPEGIASDPDTLARFEREARSLAALNHPHIAQVYGLEQGDDSAVIVMELVEGEDLAVILERGPLELADALPIARQIAEALEAAHEAGIVHRDLKPANIKVRTDETVKVLDFGLAKATDASASGSSTGVADSPTLVSPAVTGVGMIMGTAAYMSPEQARGKPVDRRADVWAFGCVLFEMLSGRRVFGGDDVSMTLASVLKQDMDWGTLPTDVPAPVRRMLERCFEVEPRSRYQSMGDVRVEIEEWTATGFELGTAPVAKSRSALPLLASVAAAVVVTAAVTLWGSGTLESDAQSPQRLTVLAPPGESLFQDAANVAISPDGQTVAFVTGSSVDDARLWLRVMDDLAPREVEGSAGAMMPFWSPDGSMIGFFADGKLMTTSVTGGRPQTIADVPEPRGATWNSDGVIVFAPGAGPLQRVSSNGGEITEVTTILTDAAETGHRFPWFLPDGRHFLYASLPTKDGGFGIYVGSLDSTDRKFVLRAEGTPVYAEPGYLIYSRRGVLVAHPFDAKRHELTGEAVPLGDTPGEMRLLWASGPAVSAAHGGSLAYLTPGRKRLAWLDVTGREIEATNVPPGPYMHLSMSPDERFVALTKLEAARYSTLVADLTRGGLSPIPAPEANFVALPVWSPDGRRIAYSSDLNGPFDLFLYTVNSSEIEVLFQSDSLFKHAVSWSPDGQTVVFTDSSDGQSDLWTINPDGDREPSPFLESSGNDEFGAVSPDGRWMAYSNQRSGGYEAWIQAFPGPGEPLRLTTGGVIEWGLWWREDGRQLLVLNTALELMLIDVETSPALSASTPRVVGRLTFPTVASRSIAASADLQRLLAVMPEANDGRSITVLQNWPQAIGTR